MGFGGGKTQSVTPQRYNAIQLSSSAYGGAVPLLYGQQRLPYNLIWYGNFTSTPQNTSNGGKGGGGQQASSYTYSTSFAAGLCEGPILSVGQVWLDKDKTTLSAQGLTLFSGAGGQAAWSYLTTNFPAQAIPYDHQAYVAGANFSLGSSASMPNLTFEVRGLLSLAGLFTANFTSGVAAGATAGTLSTPWTHATGLWTVTFSDLEQFFCQFTNNSTAVTFTSTLAQSVSSAVTIGGYLDADPSLLIPDYVTDPNHGLGLPSNFVATLTGANSYQTYVQALGLFLSLYETTQRAAADCLKEILTITNSDIVWTAGQMKVIPYCDSPVTGNGVTFTPDLTPIYSFGDDDFIPQNKTDLPVQLTRKPIADTYNHVKIEYLDRSHDYNVSVVEATDLGDIANNGERVMQTQSFHEICNQQTALTVAQLMLQTSLYERNTYIYRLPFIYCLLEPMDYVAITDAGLGLTNQLVRITKITDDANDELELECMEITGTVRNTPLYSWQGVQGYNANYAEAAGDVLTPIFFEAASTLVTASGGRELWIGVCTSSSNGVWGGCNVYMSFDGTTYSQVGIITSQARIGTASLTSGVDPDTTNTMTVALANTSLVLDSGTQADADNLRILAMIGDGAGIEIVSYETATLTSPGNYNITYLRRGLYGTTPGTHTNRPFMRMDGSMFQLPLDPGWLGQTLYFKFASYNIVGRATEALSDAVAYTYTPTLSAVAYNSSSQSTFSANGTCVVFSPTTAFKQTTGANSWDSSVYSVQGYTNGCAAECYFSSTTCALMLGLTTNPTASPSYTNLAFAWYAQTNGNAQIYESGNFIADFGPYLTSDLFVITHDGKHVCYWKNGVMLRSVPLGTTTFFMQIAMGTPGSAVYGMEFGSSTAAVTPFTLIPMTANVACAGTTAQPNSLITAGVWGQRCFKSKESFNNGCQVSFNIGTPQDAQQIGFSTAPALGSSSGSGPLLAGWYPHSGSNAVHIIFNGNVLYSYSGNPASTEVFTITYDNFWFRWWRNGALIASQYFASAGALFLFGDFYDPTLFAPNERFVNISFGPYGSATPNPFVATANCVTHDSTATKVGGVSAWDSSIYSLNSYTNCHVQWKASVTGDIVMVGLATNPTINPSYTNINYAWYAQGGAGWQIYESGAAIATFSNVQVTDLVSITYDGTTVGYYLNGQLVRTVSAAGLALFMQGSFYLPGTTINSLSFGPGTVLDSVPTASIDPNAATVTYIFSLNEPNGVTGPVTNLIVLNSNIVSPPPFACTAIVTLTGFDGYLFAGTGATVGIGYLDSGSSTNVYSNTAVIPSTSPPTTTMQWQFSHVASSATAQVFMALTIPSGCTVQYGKIVLQVEYIKK